MGHALRQHSNNYLNNPQTFGSEVFGGHKSRFLKMVKALSQKKKKKWTKHKKQKHNFENITFVYVDVPSFHFLSKLLYSWLCRQGFCSSSKWGWWYDRNNTLCV